jgi:protein phosphatase 1L
MEDFYETRIDSVEGEIVGLFGVFDGHGGARAAEYVKKNLFSNLISHPKFISDTKSAIADAYNHTDSEFLKSENTQNKDAGSTASTAILVGDRLLVANVGDSRAVICRGGNAFAVSRDHKPDQTDERQRIEEAGGFVMWAGTWRVGGVLAVSRAFGDRLLKQYVVADPEIQEEKIDNSLEFLILASDGLWDVVTNEEAVAMTKPIEDPEVAAKRLMHEAYQRGSGDNITIVVVRFLFNQGQAGGSSNSKANHASSLTSQAGQSQGSSSNSAANQGSSSNIKANQSQGGSTNIVANKGGSMNVKAEGGSLKSRENQGQGGGSSNSRANQGHPSNAKANHGGSAT